MSDLKKERDRFKAESIAAAIKPSAVMAAMEMSSITSAAQHLSSRE